MKKIILSSLVCASMMFAANSEYKYEVTPLVGGAYTEGNLNLDRDYTNAGLSVAANLDDSMFDQVELGFLKTIGELDYKGSTEDTELTRFFTNVIKEYSLSGNSSLYGLVGAGIELFGNELFEQDTGLFGNYGVGYKYTFDNGMAFKFDLRHLIETDHGDNTLLYTAGLAIPFGKKAVAAAPMPEPIPVLDVPKDSDRDGVYDDMDKCPNTPAGAKVDADGCAVLVDLKINFDTNSAVIKPQYNEKVEAFANYMKDNKNVKATIEAHTDSRASDAYNQKLSERRAASTVQALEDLQIDVSRLSSKGYGESQPIATNETAEGRAANRRVQARIER